MKVNELFSVQAIITEKGQEFKIPENTVKYDIHLSSEYLDHFYNDYLKVNFKTHKLMIAFVDDNRIKDSVDLLFRIIKDISGIKRSQIKSKLKNEKIVWARQLFHYGFMYLKLGDFYQCAEQTQNKRCSVYYSIKKVNENIEFGNGWRKEQFNIFKKQINKLKNTKF